MTDTRWLVVHDCKTLSMYLLESTYNPSKDAAEATEVEDWFMKSPTLHNPYSQDWMVLKVRNGTVADFKTEEWAEGFDLRSVMAVAEFGGPMPNPEQRERWRSFCQAQWAKTGRLSIGYKTINEDWAAQNDPEPSPWVDAVTTQFEVYV